jgi:hypothetical protein
VLIFFHSTEDAEIIYNDAEALNLTGTGYAWIVTEQALLPHNTPKGYVNLYEASRRIKIVFQALHTVLQ